MDISIDALFDMENRQLQMEHGKTPSPDHWRWSPCDIHDFDRMLHIAWEHFLDLHPSQYYDIHPISFCELGSGIGTKLYLAKNKYGMNEIGFEFYQEYIDRADKLGVLSYQRDLSDWTKINLPIFAAYDIIYNARPFKDDEFEGRWERLIMDSMRPGAVLIQAFKHTVPYNWPCLYRARFRGVWVKPPSQPEMQDLEVQQKITIR